MSEKSKKKKTIQFENPENNKEEIQKSGSNDKTLIDDKEKTGILKKKSVQIDEPLGLKEVSLNQDDEEKKQLNEAKVKDDKKQINDNAPPLEEKTNIGKNINEKKIPVNNEKKTKKFELKKNAIPEFSNENFDKITKLNQKLDEFKNNQKDDEMNDFIKLRSPECIEYFDKEIAKALLEGFNEMFIKR